MPGPSPVRPESFGKRNLRVVTKPLSTRKRTKQKSAPPKSDPKLYLYTAGAVLFVVLAGYALAL
jgi:hypothetical protein